MHRKVPRRSHAMGMFCGRSCGGEARRERGGTRGEMYWGVLGMGGHTHRATWAPHAAMKVYGRAKGRPRARAGGRTGGHRAI